MHILKLHICAYFVLHTFAYGYFRIYMALYAFFVVAYFGIYFILQWFNLHITHIYSITTIYSPNPREGTKQVLPTQQRAPAQLSGGWNPISLGHLWTVSSAQEEEENHSPTCFSDTLK